MTRAKISLVLLAGLCALLRLAAIRGDFGLDEIWSWVIAVQCQSPLEVVATAHDNNHVLNTLVLYWLKSEVAHKWLFRLPAALACCLALWFGYDVARRCGKSAGPIALVLLGLSHLSIVLGTEARGYGYLILFTLASWWSLERCFALGGFRWAACFALTASLGFFAHLTYLFAYAGLGAYSIVAVSRRRRRLRPLLALHAAPLATAGALYVLYVRRLTIGGGEISPLSKVLIETLSLMAGGPPLGKAAMIAAVIAGGLLTIALINAFRRDGARAALFATAILIAPALTLIASEAIVLYPRYFLVPVLFGYLAIAEELSRWFDSKRIGRIAVVGLLSLYVLGNLMPVLRLAIEGRAEYSAAVRYIAENSAGPQITLSSDHDFRNWYVAKFHKDLEPALYHDRGKQLVYVDPRSPSRGPEWYLAHSFEGQPLKPERLVDPLGNRYELVRVFPSHSISGWTWWLYRRQRAEDGG